MPFLVLSASDPGLTLAAWDSLFVVVTHDVLTVERLAVWQFLELAHHERVGMKLNVLTLLDVGPEGVLPFSAAARKASEKMTREMSPLMKCSAVVFPRDGFLASGVRSVVGAVGRVATRGFPMRVFKELPEAIDWLAVASDGTLPADFDRDQLLASVSELRKSEG